MSFGDQLKVCREQRGLSRAGLADLLGVSVSAISNYENGLSFPKEEVILRLFDCLHAEPNTLFQDSFRGGHQVLTRSERQLLEQYRGLSPKGRETVRSVVEALCAYRDELEESRQSREQSAIVHPEIPSSRQDYCHYRSGSRCAAIADIQGVQKVIENRKRYIDLTGNNLNHPNDYLARIYAQVLMTLLK